MNDLKEIRKERKKLRLASRVALTGGALFGGITLLAGLCDYCFGPTSGHGGLTTLAVQIVGIPPDLLLQRSGLDKSPLMKIFGLMNGWLFAAVINAIIGMLLFTIVAYLFEWISKDHHETKNRVIQ
jgi:hypothetical protein